MRYSEILSTAEMMPSVAYDRSATSAWRLSDLETIAGEVTQQLDRQGTPQTRGDYLQSLRIRTWLACMPTLFAIAELIPQDASIAESVLANLTPLLEELMLNSTEHSEGHTGSTADGLLGEMAVLGTIFWNHATNPDHELRSILPATNRQDSSWRGGWRGGFDSLLVNPRYVTPIQVKANDNIEQVLRGSIRRGYQDQVAVVYINRLLGREFDQVYAPQFLADAVARRDSAMLTRANELIEEVVAATNHKIVNARVYYTPKQITEN